MATLVRGTETDKWLPKVWRKCTFPVLCPPAKTSEDLVGAAFLIHYKQVPYIVTAGHVVNFQDPVIAFGKKDGTVLGVKSSFIRKTGVDWINHPAGLDMAAIPFLLPLSVIEKLDKIMIRENQWSPQVKKKISDEVVHLGYPECCRSKGKEAYCGKMFYTRPR